MSHRKIVGLKWARQLPARPQCIPLSRPRGAKAAGLRYERAVAAQVKAQCPAAKHGVWWEFEDIAGHGYCQTDVVAPLGGLVVVLECKYTWVEQARRQLEELYLPVVGLALRKPCLGVEVCKVLVPGTRGIVVGSLAEAVRAQGLDAVWHNFSPPKSLVGANVLLRRVA